MGRDEAMKRCRSEPPDIADLRRDLTFDADLLGKRLHFATTYGLFSPKGIDAGTRLLLDHFGPERDDERTFDLGCGYGPLGLAFAAQSPQGHVEMVDRDFLAVDYANRNAEQNHLPNAVARLGHGFVDTSPEARFDNVISNLPAKTGGELLRVMLHDAHQHLVPGGRICVVVVTGLRRFIERHLKDVFGNHKKLKQSTGHTVAMAVRE
jgi:16S rRNA G1207 methylase RsmC